MRLMFVNWAFEDHGSAQDIFNYTQVARELGHQVALYGPANPRSSFNYSLDINAADAVIFIFEFETWLERLDYARLIAKVPRERRIVIDCDGKYNAAISVAGDVNHLDAGASEHWVSVCDSLSDKIFQPTFHPLRRNVRPFLFHAYNQVWEQPLGFCSKEYGMVYVGMNWFRWHPLKRVLQAVEPIRAEVGRIGLIGDGWNAVPSRHDERLIDVAHYTDPAYLRKLDVEVMPPIRFDEVIHHMGKGILSPVIYRPLFDHLRLVTCRTFETLAASTIPVFGQDAAYVREIYGEEAVALVLPDDEPHGKILDILRRPEYYAEIVLRMRRHLAGTHSYAARLQQLIDMVQS